VSSFQWVWRYSYWSCCEQIRFLSVGMDEKRNLQRKSKHKRRIGRLSDLHTKRSPTQSDTYQMLYWYNWFSWWWARGCSKHVQNWNKHIENNCASSWSFTKNPFNKCCITYSYCSSLQHQPHYPIVTFRQLFSSALQQTVCDRHTSAYFTLVLFCTYVKQVFIWGCWNIKSQTV
jgi:hypothetical protein